MILQLIISAFFSLPVFSRLVLPDSIVSAISQVFSLGSFFAPVINFSAILYCAGIYIAVIVIACLVKLIISIIP